MTPEPTFTPLFDLILEYYADVLKRGGARDRALVYGQVNRQCEKSLGYCFESIDNMAEQIGMGRSTFKRHLAALVSDRWIGQFVVSNGGRNRRSSYLTFHKLLKELEKRVSETLPPRESEENTLPTREGIDPKPSRQGPKPSRQGPKPSHNGGGIKETIKKQEDTTVKDTNLGSASKKNSEPKTLGVVGIHRDELARREAAKKRVRPPGTIKERIAADKQNGRALIEAEEEL